MASDNFSVLNGPADQVAARLLGCQLERKVRGRLILVRIVETEAYDQADVASHSYKGETARTAVMFGPPGHLYVYFTYGMHYCCNIVVGPKGYGAAVLLRAVEPLSGEDFLAERRPLASGVNLTNGPAKLCQALSIGRPQNGHNLAKQPIRLIIKPALPNDRVVQTTRIGISRARDVPWRFYIKGNPYVSKT